MSPVIHVAFAPLPIEESWLELLDASSGDLLLVEVQNTLVVLVLLQVDLDGAVGSSLADQPGKALHLEHWAGVVANLLVHVEAAVHVVNGYTWWTSHVGWYCVVELRFRRWSLVDVGISMRIWDNCCLSNYQIRMWSWCKLRCQTHFL